MDIRKLFSLEGRVALVTGATHGLGMAVATALAGAGATLAVNGHSADRLDKALKTYENKGIDAKGYLFDVTDEQAVAEGVARIEREAGPIDILVNNAGVVLSNDQLAQDVTEEEWDRVVDTDYKAVFFLTQRVAEIMIKQERGNIINIASVVARVASTRMLPYASAKAAVVQMTRCMAFEWARFNIRANCICPGYIETNMTQTTLNKPAAYEAITRPIPHNRKVGDPLDIAAAALFLGCDCSDMVNGTPLYVDGARSIW